MSPKGGRREGAGRKPLPAQERRRNSITVALTDQEMAEVEALADGGSLAGYVQRLIARHLERKRRAR